MADSSEAWAYRYQPSVVAATIVCAIFAISSVLHFYQMIRTRTLYNVPLLIGCLIEAIGFGARIASGIEAPNFTLGPYIVQALLILIAPALLAATVYMVLGYVILVADGEKHSMIRKKFLTKIFVCGDFFSFMVQSSGAGLLTKDDPDAPISGKWIIVGGLMIQLFFFGFFMIVSIVFYTRICRRPSARSQMPGIPWRMHMWVLFIVSGLIMIRSVFRVVEYVRGTNGYLLGHEIYLYIFDAALMCGVVVLLNVMHPSQITGLISGKGAVAWVVKRKKTEKLPSLQPEDKEKQAGTNDTLPRQRWLHARRAQQVLPIYC